MYVDAYVLARMFTKASYVCVCVFVCVCVYFANIVFKHHITCVDQT